MLNAGRITGAITGLLNRVVCLALSVFILVVIIKPEILDSFSAEEGGEHLSGVSYSLKLILVLGALLLIVLNLNLVQILLFVFWNSEVRRYIASKSTSGTARVSLDAIERSLIATTKGIPEITKCRLRIYRIGAKRHKVEVLFWISEDCNVLNISEKLRLLLKKRFSELVSVEPDERVFFEISLAGIQKRKNKASYASMGPPKDAIDASKRQFKGPVYPVGGDL